MTTDTSELGLERLICMALTGYPCDSSPYNYVPEPAPGLQPSRTGMESLSVQERVLAGGVRKPPVPYGGVGWICGAPNDYDREYCVDLEQLSTFLRITQPEIAGAFSS